ncbi:putative polyprotein [Freshwater macrophyte associated picorna-like virus 5]|nr:putative polyprotein [Freshwater macrophyte associated picorna-like virus 5]
MTTKPSLWGENCTLCVLPQNWKRLIPDHLNRIAILILVGPKYSQTKKQQENKKNNKKLYNSIDSSVFGAKEANLSPAVRRILEEEDFVANQKERPPQQLTPPPLPALIMTKPVRSTTCLFKKVEQDLFDSRLPYDFMNNIKPVPVAEDWDEDLDLRTVSVARPAEDWEDDCVPKVVDPEEVLFLDSSLKPKEITTKPRVPPRPGQTSRGENVRTRYNYSTLIPEEKRREFRPIERISADLEEFSVPNPLFRRRNSSMAPKPARAVVDDTKEKIQSVLNSPLPVDEPTPTIKSIIVEPVLEKLTINSSNKKICFKDTIRGADQYQGFAAGHRFDRFRVSVQKLLVGSYLDDQDIHKLCLAIFWATNHQFFVLNSQTEQCLTSLAYNLFTSRVNRDTPDLGIYELHEVLMTLDPATYSDFGSKFFEFVESSDLEPYDYLAWLDKKDNTKASIISLVLDIAKSFKNYATGTLNDHAKEITRFLASLLLACLSYYRLPDSRTIILELSKLFLQYSHLVSGKIMEFVTLQLEQAELPILDVNGYSIFDDKLTDILGLFCYDSILSYFGLLGESWRSFKQFLNPRVTFRTVIEKVMGLLKSIVNACCEFYKTGSTDAFFKRKPTPEEWIFGARVLSDNRMLLGNYDAKWASDTVKASPFLPQSWSQCSNTYLIKEINSWLAIAPTYSPDELSVRVDPLVWNEFTQVITLLRERKEELVSNIVKTQPRKVPLSLVLLGEPGAGKSTLLTELGKLLAYLENREYSSSNTFTWDPTLNYDDTFDPSQDYYVMDDANAIPVPKVPNPSDKTFVSALMKFVNTVANNAESANVNKKGAYYHNPKLLVQTMNKLPLRTDVLRLLNAPEAYYSRMHYVVHVVTADGLNWRNHPRSSTRPAKWIFTIHKIGPNGGLCPALHEFKELGHFLKWVAETYGKHMKLQEELNAMLVKDEGSVPCPVCNVITRFHGDNPCPLPSSYVPPPHPTTETVQVNAGGLPTSFETAGDYATFIRHNNRYPLFLYVTEAMFSEHYLRHVFRFMFEIILNLNLVQIAYLAWLFYFNAAFLPVKIVCSFLSLGLSNSPSFALWLHRTVGQWTGSTIQRVVNMIGSETVRVMMRAQHSVERVAAKAEKLIDWSNFILVSLSAVAGIYCTYKYLTKQSNVYPLSSERSEQEKDDRPMIVEENTTNQTVSYIPKSVAAFYLEKQRLKAEMFQSLAKNTPPPSEVEPVTQTVQDLSVNAAEKKEVLWTSINKIPNIPKTTVNFDSGFQICQKSVGFVNTELWCPIDMKMKISEVHAVRIRPTMIVFNKHVLNRELQQSGEIYRRYMFKPGESFQLNFQFGTLKFSVKAEIGLNLVQHPSMDLMALHTNISAPLGVTVYDLLPSYSSFDKRNYGDVWYADQHNVRLDATLCVTPEDDTYNLLMIRGRPDPFGTSNSGLCGMPIIARFGQNPVVVGLHWATGSLADGNGKSVPSGSTYAILLSKNDVDIMTEFLPSTVNSSLLLPSDRFQPMYGVLDKEHNQTEVEMFDEPVLVPTPAYSEMQHAFKNGSQAYELLGTLPTKQHNSTFKSRMKQVPKHQKIISMAEKYGIKPEWGIPTFRSNSSGDPNNRINPWTIKLSQVRNSTPDLRVLAAAKRKLKEKLSTFDWSNVAIKPLDQILAGNDVYMSSVRSKPMDVSTSTGLPWNTRKGAKLQLGQEFVGVAEDFIEPLKKVLEQMVESPDLVPLPVCYGSIKDEILSRAKIDANKMRVFWISPSLFIQLQKVALGSVLDVISTFGLEMGISIGRNYNDRNTIARVIEKIKTVAPDFEHEQAFSVGDMASQDDVEGIELTLAALEPLFEVLEEKTDLSEVELSIIRRVLVACCFSLRLVKGDVALAVGGNISGQLVTSLLNCLVNILVHLYCFYRIPELQDLDFWKLVFLQVMGDDSEGAIAAVIRKYYNQLSIQAGFAECGIDYTSSQKTKHFENPLERLEDCVYLQFGFWKDPELKEWRAMLSLKSVFKALLYYEEKSSISTDGLINDTVTNMMLAVYYRGRSFYDQFCSDLSQIYPDYPFKTYEQLRQREVANNTVYVEEEGVPEVSISKERLVINSSTTIPSRDCSLNEYMIRFHPEVVPDPDQFVLNFEIPFWTAGLPFPSIAMMPDRVITALYKFSTPRPCLLSHDMLQETSGCMRYLNTTDPTRVAVVRMFRKYAVVVFIRKSTIQSLDSLRVRFAPPEVKKLEDFKFSNVMRFLREFQDGVPAECEDCFNKVYNFPYYALICPISHMSSTSLGVSILVKFETPMDPPFGYTLASEVGSLEVLISECRKYRTFVKLFSKQAIIITSLRETARNVTPERLTVNSSEVSKIELTSPVETIDSGPVPTENPVQLKVSPTESLHRWTHIKELVLGGESMDDNVLLTPLPLITSYFSNPLVSSTISRMRTWRGSFEVKLSVIGVPSSYSLYVATVLPADVGSSSFHENHLMHVPHLFQRDSVIINSAQSMDITFDLPFISPNRTALTVPLSDPFGNEWYLWLKCVFPVEDLFVVSQFCRMNVYIRPKEDFGFEDIIVNARTYSKTPKPDGWVDTFKKMISHPISTGLSAASTLASAMGYTRVPDKSSYKPMVIKTNPDLNACDGAVSDLITTGLFNNSRLPDGFCDDSELLVSNLVQRETMISFDNWTSTDPRLSVITCLPVTPFIDALAEIPGAMTVPAYIGAPFKYWRGDVKYKVLVACNNMMSGTLCLFHSSTRYNAGTVMSFDPTNRAMNVVMDISQELSAEITIPWLSTSNALLTTRLLESSSDTTACNGFFHIAVVSNLVGPATSFAAGLCVTLACDQNFSVGLYRSFLGPVRTDVNELSFQNTLVVDGLVGAETSLQTESIMLGGMAGSPNMGSMMFSEQFLSIKALLQRFSLGAPLFSILPNGGSINSFEVILSYPFYPKPRATLASPASNFSYPVSYDPNTNILSSAQVTPFNLQAYYSAMFHGVKGSQLYTVVPVALGGNGTVVTLAGREVETPASGSAQFVTELVTAVNTTTALAESFANSGFWIGPMFANNLSSPPVIKLPYASPLNYWPNYGTYTTGNIKAVELLVGIKTSSASSVSLCVFTAAGDDMCLFHFRHTPLVYPSPT